MSYALGQPVPLTINTKDASGALADVGVITLAVTKPDGTTDTYTAGQITHTPPGVYALDYVPAAVGLYDVRWTATGVNASAPKVDSFYVPPATAPPLVSLAEGRRHIGFSATGADDQLADFLQTASRVCEDYTGKIWRRTALTVVMDGRDPLRLRAPVISVTSVVEDGATLAASAYTLDSEKGLLYRYGIRWSRMARQNITVVYVAGPSDGVIPESVRQGVLEMVRHLWETQRGAAGVPGRGPDGEWSPEQGFSIPRRVQELWDPQRTVLMA